MNEDDGGIRWWQEVGQQQEEQERRCLMDFLRRPAWQRELELDRDFARWLNEQENRNGPLR